MKDDKMKMNNIPLVSVCVITYNSSEFIIESLDSAYRQSYHNIELIVSDDCSTDDTVEKIQQWLSEFGHRFTKAVLLTASKNTGIAANHAKALEQAQGEWIKFVDGDDILYPNAIRSFVSFVQKEKTEDIALVVSSLKVFKENPGNVLYTWPNFKISKNIHKQLKKQVIGSYIKSLSVFMKRDVLLKLGGFNLDYQMLEDDPLWIKFLTNGYKFHFNEDVLAGYRIHANAISNGSLIPKELFFPSLYAFKKEVIFPLMKKERLYFNYIIQKQIYKIHEKLVCAEKVSKISRFRLKLLGYLNRTLLSGYAFLEYVS